MKSVTQTIYLGREDKKCIKGHQSEEFYQDNQHVLSSHLDSLNLIFNSRISVNFLLFSRSTSVCCV